MGTKPNPASASNHRASHPPQLALPSPLHISPQPTAVNAVQASPALPASPASPLRRRKSAPSPRACSVSCKSKIAPIYHQSRPQPSCLQHQLQV